MVRLQQYRDGCLCRTPQGEDAFSERYDVIVAGLGTAGICAAIAAARQGLRVLGLEQLEAVGGQSTLGSVLPYYFGNPGGLYEELDRKTLGRMERGFVPTQGLHPDCRIFVLEQEAKAAGAELRCGVRVTGVWMEDSRVCGLQWLQGGRFYSAAARVVIDCTADGTVAALCGCRFLGGRASDGGMQPYSLPMLTCYQGTLCSQFIDSGHLSSGSPEEVSAALVEAMNGPMYLREPFEPIDRVISYSPFLGVREGRRILGDQVLTLEELLNGQVTREPLFYARANLDKHGKDFWMESPAMQDWALIGGLWEVSVSIPVPLGALIPRETEGLLAAGRQLSADHDLASALRMKRDMQKCGEAAGLAAAEAVRSGCGLREISYERLRPLLEQSGCLGPEPPMERLRFRDRENPPFYWLTDPEELRAGLRSEEPGAALLSCRRLGAAGAALLREGAEAKERLLRENCLIGLGLLGELRPALIELALCREPGPRAEWLGCSALCLIGRLGGAEPLPALENLALEGEGPRKSCAAAAAAQIRRRILCERKDTP